MKIGIVGVGYVGLVTGVILATKENEVICLDKDETLVEQLKSGRPHIYEKGIESLLKQTLQSGKLHVTTSEEKYLRDCDIIFICVDTPTSNGSIDLTHFYQAVELVAKAIKASDKFISIVVKSTVLPGTTVKAKNLIEDTCGKKHQNFGVGANPEFLREGSAVDDFLNADRIIIGAEDEMTKERLVALYNSWDCEKIVVNSNTAEFIKYESNSLLALLISFSNEMANISAVDEEIDFKAVLKGVSADKRINPIIPGYGKANPGILSYLVPGPGYGGSCFPKDIEAFSSFAESMGIRPYMLQAIQETNSNQPRKIISLIEKSIGEPYKKNYLVLGFSHKPNTNDTRQSASTFIIERLLSEGAKVVLHDPVALGKAKVYFKGQHNISFTANWGDCLKQTDVIILLTPWEEYQDLTSAEYLKLLAGKTIIDTRLMFERELFKNAKYVSF